MIAYMTASRLIIQDAESFAEVELARTPFRIFTALFYWLVIKDVLAGPISRPGTLSETWHVRILFLLLASYPFGPDPQYSPYDAVILAVTSIPVGFAEELFFRGIVQNLCVKRWGRFAGLMIATTLFTAYHAGVIDNDPLNYVSIFLAGLALGAIYLKSGSLTVVIIIHAAIYTSYSLPHIFGDIDLMWRVAMEFAAAWVALHWLLRKTGSIPGINGA